MKYVVGELCFGCGLCADICPEVFKMVNGDYAVALDVDTDSMDAVDAMDSCPIGVIEEL